MGGGRREEGGEGKGAEKGDGEQWCLLLNVHVLDT
jgi:hypothetical protein